MSSEVEINPWHLADELYKAGYKARQQENEYDPRGCTQWQDVVGAIVATKPKKYALFSGSNYYPSGGVNDFDCTGNDVLSLVCEALLTYDPKRSDGTWFHVVTIPTFEEVFDNGLFCYFDTWQVPVFREKLLTYCYEGVEKIPSSIKTSQQLLDWLEQETMGK
jgi:hypothetical protein